MKNIALSLGLSEDATEQQIIAKIGTLKLSADRAEKLEVVLSKQSEGLDENQKKIFITLSKTDIDQAVEFASSITLNKKEEEVKEEPKSTKATKIADVLKAGKSEPEGKTEEDKDSFDHMQKNDPAKLAQLKRENPAEYQKKAEAYLALKRKGK